MGDNIKVCTDCLMGYHYGYTELPNGGWAPGDSGDSVTDLEPLGLVRDLVSRIHPKNEFDGSFSWESCKGCGSALGGDRFEFVVVPADRV